MPSKFGEKIEDIRDKAFELALIPAAFVLNPIALYFLRKRRVRREMAKDVLISSDWTIIMPQPSLKITKRFQKVALVLENCKKTFGKYRENLMFSDETVITPAKQIVVELFDEDGNKYDLKLENYSVGKYDEKENIFYLVSAGFKSLKDELPTDKTFKEVRIRSDKPFQCKAVIWHDYDLK